MTYARRSAIRTGIQLAAIPRLDAAPGLPDGYLCGGWASAIASVLSGRVAATMGNAEAVPGIHKRSEEGEA